LKPIEIKNENSLNLKRYLEDVRKKAWEHEVTKIEFIGPSIWQDDNDRLGYASVRIDGISYKPGDCVILRSTGKFVDCLVSTIAVLFSDLRQSSIPRKRRARRQP
jgi:hypothetical protein